MSMTVDQIVEETRSLPHDGVVDLVDRILLPEPINIQPRGGKCKPYQLRQVRNIIEEYKL